MKAKKKGRSDDSRINCGVLPINVRQTHQEHAFNTTNSETTTNHATQEELNDKIEDVTTRSAITTQDEQPRHCTITSERKQRISTTILPEAQLNTK